MFRYDSDYSETTWRYEADAAELAQLDIDRRDMQEYPPPPLQMPTAADPVCCDDPASYTFSASFGRESETGYCDSDHYRCNCGNLIDSNDYAALVEWANRDRRKQKREAA